mmetsp:Transcript_17097/g.25293  ORF Transcript_17097/g.25293 Transcript_17097/m.25293 type:complete len:446 (-) Transcript_17097:39-1376(-)
MVVVMKVAATAGMLLAGLLAQGRGEMVDSESWMASVEDLKAGVVHESLVEVDAQGGKNGLYNRELKFGECQQTARNSFPQPTNCACQADCHIFGDPHYTTFASRKSKFANPPQGTRSSDDWIMMFFKLGDFQVYGNVRNKYVMSVYWDGKQVASVENCKTGKTYKTRVKSFDTFDVSMDVVCTADDKPNKPPHLNTTLYLTSYDDTGESSSRILKDASTEGGAVGYCVNGKNDYADMLEIGESLEGKAQSSSLRSALVEQLAEKKVGTKGLECSCRGTCAAWGDPHILVFDKFKMKQDILVKPSKNQRGEPSVLLYESGNILIDAITGKRDRIVSVLVTFNGKTTEYPVDEICPENIRSGSHDMQLGKFRLKSDTRSLQSAKQFVTLTAACVSKQNMNFLNVCIDKQIDKFSSDQFSRAIDGGFRTVEAELGSYGFCFGKSQKPM